eukprot:jgi/Tetstr1/444207/TSEL_032100.t1
MATARVASLGAPVSPRATSPQQVSPRRSVAAKAVGPVAGAARPLPTLSSVKGILFDIDGTLCNSDPLHLAVFQDMLAEVGFNGGAAIDEEFFRVRIAGRHNPDIMADFFPEWPEDKQTQFSDDKEARFRMLAGDRLERMPGLSEFLQWMDQAGVRRVAVTNAPRANAEVMLGGMRLREEFEALVIGAECSRPKPFPDPYQAGLAALGMRPDETIAIEDSPSGLRAAVAAGIPTIGIMSGQTAESLVAAGACYLVQDYNDLLALLSADAAADAVALPA